jgi:hypothetical protein
MCRAGVSQYEIAAVSAEPTAGNHDFVVRTCAATIDLSGDCLDIVPVGNRIKE